MKKQHKIILYTILLSLGLLLFIFPIFIFQAPDGVLGFVLCLTSIYLMLGSIIKLCKLSQKFKNSIITFLDLLFFLP